MSRRGRKLVEREKKKVSSSPSCSPFPSPAPLCYIACYLPRYHSMEKLIEYTAAVSLLLCVSPAQAISRSLQRNVSQDQQRPPSPLARLYSDPASHFHHLFLHLFFAPCDGSFIFLASLLCSRQIQVPSPMFQTSVLNSEHR